MSLLKVHSETTLEFEKDGYYKLCPTILDVEGDYLPAWFFENSESYIGIYVLQELDIVQLQNSVVSIVNEETISGYTGASGNGFIYGLKQAQTLDSAKIYRMKNTQNTGTEYLFIYSEAFRKI